MKSVNKVILIGNLGGDPELRHTPGNVPVVNFSLATNESWTDQSGEKHEKTEWHRIVIWRKLAEICNEHLRKGSKVYLEGKLQTRSWEDQSGQKRYMTEIVATEVVFLDGKGEGGGWLPRDEDAPPAGRGEKTYDNDNFDDFKPPAGGEDDLPF